jgi:hypothetical protein
LEEQGINLEILKNTKCKNCKIPSHGINTCPFKELDRELDKIAWSKNIVVAELKLRKLVTILEEN